MKIIAFYLPQFHTFPENDKWWGKGFTEWENVKNAKPCFEGHIQPKIPLDNYYYNLLDKNAIRWQVGLAKKYGVYGFCYYHYWFDGKMLMQRPMEILLNNPDITIPFCICWANEDWTRAWAKKDKTILISQTYGGRKDWEEHFQYLLPFFKDERYIKVNGKILFVIYRPELISVLKDMLSCWDELARKNGLPGISYAYQQPKYNHLTMSTGSLFDYGIEYQPGYVRLEQIKTLNNNIKRALNVLVRKFHLPQRKWSTMCYDYDTTWKKILGLKPRDEKMFPGAFVDWDNTPRYKNGSSIEYGYTAEKFRKYLSLQINRAKNVYKKDIIFLFAWNEWGEGGYLEPDENEKYARLEAVRDALMENGEFPAEKTN